LVKLVYLIGQVGVVSKAVKFVQLNHW